MSVEGLGSFKILSIDGGGIKGLYSAVILADFEKKYGKLNQYFDLICGTSTGGIIAIALAAGIPASEIVNLYRDKGPTIFPAKRKISRLFRSIKQLAVNSKYSDRELKNALLEVFGDKKVKDCQTNILIPTANITTGIPSIIKSDHSEGLNRDNEHSLVEVALATSAAPTYFPIQTISTMREDHQFVDGGIVANNPSLYGIQEANKWFLKSERPKFATYSLLSVSTLHQSFSFDRKLKVKSRSLVLWNLNLIQLIMDSQAVATHYHVKYLNDSLKGQYVRIGSEELTPNESKYIGLDNASKKSIAIMVEKGHQASEKWIDSEETSIFFRSKKQKSRGEEIGSVS